MRASSFPRGFRPFLSRMRRWSGTASRRAPAGFRRQSRRRPGAEKSPPQRVDDARGDIDHRASRTGDGRDRAMMASATILAGHHVVPALHLVHQIAVQDGEDGGRKAVELPVLPGGFTARGRCPLPRPFPRPAAGPRWISRCRSPRPAAPPGLPRPPGPPIRGGWYHGRRCRRPCRVDGQYRPAPRVLHRLPGGADEQPAAHGRGLQ